MASPYKKNAANISTIMIFYVASAIMCYDLRTSVPPLIALFFEGYTIPFRYMYRPFYPVLKMFGWVVSDGAELPTPYGIVAGSVIWILIIIFVSYIFTAKPDKKRAHEEYWGG